MTLRDRVRRPVRVLFVGINPGLRSAQIDHHFAGYSNRFWKLLHESGLVPEPIGTEDDDRLPEWGYGITNLVPRATAGIDCLTRDDYVAGEVALRRKVMRWKPEIVAFVGLTVYRAVFGIRGTAPVRFGFQKAGGGHASGRKRERSPREGSSERGSGLREGVLTFAGAKVFVLPNPSGRNANFTYKEMLTAFRALARAADRSSSGPPSRRRVGPPPDPRRSGARVGPFLPKVSR
jgi:G:T/U-mismatch repair DNA glycosylase